jgi:hypothetical protein
MPFPAGDKKSNCNSLEACDLRIIFGDLTPFYWNACDLRNTFGDLTLFYWKAYNR